MEIKQLEKALEVIKGQSDANALYILKNAVQLFLGAQEKAKPVDSKPKPLPVPTSDKDTPKVSDVMERLKKIQEDYDKRNPDACPYCGVKGLHYCMGRKPDVPHDQWFKYQDQWKAPFGMGTGIEYLSNQPTAMTNCGEHTHSLGGAGGHTHSYGLGGHTHSVTVNNLPSHTHELLSTDDKIRIAKKAAMQQIAEAYKKALKEGTVTTRSIS